jgi:nucleoside-diphosphate-sugar epimerase
VRKGIPLPLASLRNLRSFVALDNLLDFVVTCMAHPQAASQIFLVSDGYDLSTPELIRSLAHETNVTARLVPFPVWALGVGAALIGKSDAVQRLCGNLQVDISKARSLLGWTPPITVKEGLHRAVNGTY